MHIYYLLLIIPFVLSRSVDIICDYALVNACVKKGNYTLAPDGDCSIRAGFGNFTTATQGKHANLPTVNETSPITATELQNCLCQGFSTLYNCLSTVCPSEVDAISVAQSKKTETCVDVSIPDPSPIYVTVSPKPQESGSLWNPNDHLWKLISSIWVLGLIGTIVGLL